MTIKERYLALKEMAASIDAKLLATDERYNGAVIAHHDDGSHFYFNHAFLVKHSFKIPPEEITQWMSDDVENWYIIFTEHHGTMILNGDENTVQAFSNKMQAVDAATLMMDKA